MYQGTRVLLKRYVFRVQKIPSKENVFGVQEFSLKVNVSGYKSFPQKRMYSEYKSFPRKKMYSPKRTWLRYRVWRWRLFSSGWKEAVNLRLNHSICWKILKIFRKIWKCKNENTNMTEEIDLEELSEKAATFCPLGEHLADR